jgi:glycine oxidase
MTQDGRMVAARQYVVTAGAWTDRVLGWLAPSIDIHPVRGQMVMFDPGRRLIDHIVTVGRRYVVPRLDGVTLVGSTEEPEAGFDRSTTPDAENELVGFARRLVPGLRDHCIARSWAGLRPGTADGLPVIGRRADECDDLTLAAGHFRAGIQTSIGTAACVRALVLSEPPPVPLEPFAVGRTPHPPLRAAFRS